MTSCGDVFLAGGGGEAVRELGGGAGAPGRVGRLRPQPHLGGPLRRRQHLQLAQVDLHLHRQPAFRTAADFTGAHGKRWVATCRTEINTTCTTYHTSLFSYTTE